jgi:formylglycine-generating enzyme required for sulfatase activity
MQDSDVLGNINQLTSEEHALWEKESRGEATEEDRLRLKRIQVTLDQCWDYLNQRRALRDARRNPDEAKVRDADVVERYEQ